MRSRKTEAIPARLEAGRRRFEQWRRTRQGRARIPEQLWRSAVKLAGVYGLCRTARALRLDYNALKRRVNSVEPQEASEPETARAFVELVPPSRACNPECIVELDHPGGATMRIRLTGGQSPEVVTAVSKILFGAKP
jgi:hypothetical protein